jgi:uncharacterized membrane protein
LASFRKALRDAGLAFRARVVTGLAVIAPIGVTVWIVIFLFKAIDGILQPIMVRLLGQRIPGVGLLATVLLLYLVGLLIHTFGFRTLLRWSEEFLLRMPFLRDIYSPSKMIMEAFTKPEGSGFKRVVTFDYPRVGCRSLGFVTNETILADGTREVAVYVPTTPNPTAGFVLFLPSDQVEASQLTVEEAVKIVVSGGVVMPRPLKEIAPPTRSIAPSSEKPALPESGAASSPTERSRDVSDRSPISPIADLGNMEKGTAQ